MDFGYIDFFGIKCTYTQDKLDFYLIPVDDSEELNFWKFHGKENFIVPFKSDIYDCSYIYVEKVVVGYMNKILLKAKYVSKQMPNEGVYMYTLVGDEIDEFFSPIDYFLMKNVMVAIYLQTFCISLQLYRHTNLRLNQKLSK